MKKSFVIHLVVALAIGLTIAQLPAQTAMAESEKIKLTANDGAGGDLFGYSVAISGDTAVVGAMYDDSGRGSAYVFVRSGNNWTPQAKLWASDNASGDYFGWSVAISGNTIVVGAAFDDAWKGSAYVFVRSGTSWTEQAKLTAGAGAGREMFGRSVAISGDTIVVGAPKRYQDPKIGSAYVFVRSGTSWTKEAKLWASDNASGDFFGNSVGISGDTAVVGAYQDDNIKGVDAGSAYVFVRSGTSWTEQAKLIAGDGAPGDQLGHSVSIGDDTVVAGAPGDDIYNVGGGSGAAYVFVRSGTSWPEQAKLIADDRAPGDQLGYSMSIVDDTVVAGAPFDDSDRGSAYVFVRSGTSWTKEAKLWASDNASGDRLGNSVGISGDTAVVGAYQDDNIKGVDAGSAYVYEAIINPDTIAATVDIQPDTLTLRSKGKWITCYIELPEGYDVADIAVEEGILLNNEVEAEPEPSEIGDYDDDSIADLMVKFNRSDVQSILEPGDEVEITVTGEVAEEAQFEGSDIIRVIE